MEFLKLMENWDGYKGVRNVRFTEAQIAKTIALITNKEGLPAFKHEYLLKEAITTTDFPNLFGFVIDREVLARYKVAVADWKSYFRMKTLQNFNTVERHKVNGADERLPLVTEKGEYLVAEVSEGHYEYKIYKHGKQFDISWEAIVNDVLGAFSDIPERFANAAIRSEAFQATSTYSSATGPNALLFGAALVDAADGATITNVGALPLTIANLQTTLALMAAQVDVNGEPIGVMGKHLVVPPALEYTARAILTSALMQWTEVGGGGGIPVPTANITPQLGLQLHVDPYLPVLDVGGKGNTTWYVFADPSQGAAMEYGYLRGNETPEICMKNSDKVSVAGGALSPFSGDFSTDNILYRVRAVYGSGQMDPRFAYAQTGS
jgi:hypothetical protein